MSGDIRVRFGQQSKFKVSTVQDPIAESAYNIYTQSSGINTSFYLTFVGTNTTSLTKNRVYTSSGLSYNPSSNTISYANTSLNFNNTQTNQSIVSFGTTDVTFSNSVIINEDLRVLGNFDLSNVSIGNVSGGSTGDLLYQYSSGITSFLPAGQFDYVLTSNGPGTIPSWKQSSGTGISSSVDYATSAGIATYATSAGIATAIAHKATHSTGGSDALTATDIGADPQGTASSAIAAHLLAASHHDPATLAANLQGILSLSGQELAAVSPGAGLTRLHYWNPATSRLEFLGLGNTLSIASGQLNAVGGSPGGSDGQLQWNSGGAFAGLPTSVVDGSGNITISGRITSACNGAASAPALSITGGLFAGGTGATTTPNILVQPPGAPVVSSWSTSGTVLGVNMPSGFNGRFIDFLTNNTRVFSLSHNGTLNLNGIIGNMSSSSIISLGTLSITLQGGSNLALSGGLLSLSQGATSHTLEVYDRSISTTDYHRIAIKTARATLSNISGPSVTAAALIPAGAMVMGVTSKITTAFGTSNGATGYQIGTLAAPGRFGSIVGTALGTTTDNRNWPPGQLAENFPSATDILLTATGGTFDGTGVIYISIQYITGQSD